MAAEENDLFKKFDKPIGVSELPSRFTFPFYYEPHPLCLEAVKKLQNHLTNQKDWSHDFGLDQYVDRVNVGKMFGVLVVQNSEKEIGYLNAFSGKLADESHWPGFVPPVADILVDGSFFRKGEKEIEAITEKINSILESEAYQTAAGSMEGESKSNETQLSELKKKVKAAKKIRNEKRNTEELTDDKITALDNESKNNHFILKDFKRKWKARLLELQTKLDIFEDKITALKKERKARSAALQKELFEAYQFLNIKGESKSLNVIFDIENQKTPPSGAGECAMPKLLQYAFLNDMKPLAMAEFWWGQAPKSEIRKHGYFYPSCKGKCEPILSHMLVGMEVDPSPMLGQSTKSKELETIFEDDNLAVINKPADFLSVPGRTNADSVYQRIKDKYPEATGPLIVHRLDRATSGLMVIPKTKQAHHRIQDQFKTRTIKKKYIALLEGNIAQEKGAIDLPLRVDLEDRPRQVVCYEHGKPAMTEWRVLERKNGQTRVEFTPITGRTHQLRMHAAHADGLNTPIVGDDLYGKKDDRLHLHAASLDFDHPITGERLKFNTEPAF